MNSFSGAGLWIQDPSCKDPLLTCDRAALFFFFSLDDEQETNFLLEKK